ncbi:MAG: glucose-6-phosphate isomerase [Actinomycetota bacterium]|nr:glucose-6-phosphate isomerase [Actinomycetota bacterium]
MTPAAGRRDFRWFWGAYSISTIGDQVTFVALPLAAFARTHDPLVVGTVTSMEIVTSVLLGLVAGALADRWAHRRLLILTDLTRGLLLVTLAAAVAVPRYPVVVLYVVAFGLGTFRQLHDAASGAALPRVVDRDELLRANGRLSASESVGNTLGPALAGALAAVGIGFAFLVDAVTFVLSALGVSRVGTLEEEGVEGRPGRLSWTALRADIGVGVRAVVEDEWMPRATLLIAALNIMTVAVEGQLVPYVRLLLHRGPVAVGVLFAVSGLAGLVAAALVSRSHGGLRGDVMIGGVVVVAAGVGAAGVRPSVITAAIALGCAGAGAMVAGTQYSALRQHRFPIRMLGRVGMATRTALHGVLPIAFVVGGLVAKTYGPDVLFVGSAAVGLAGALGVTGAGLWRLRLEDARASSSLR